MYEPVSGSDDNHLTVPDLTSFAPSFLSDTSSIAEDIGSTLLYPEDRRKSDTSTLFESDYFHSKDSTCSTEKPAGSGSRYNLLTPEGRNLARRKLLSSGPAYDYALPPPTRSWRNFLTGYTGWRMGTVVCLSAVASCLVVEFVLLLSALSVSEGGFGSGLLYKGSCSKVKSLTVWLLFPLNIVATVLISSSNYVMQVMAAPDRQEVDYAHSLATSITIGGMRFRNLQFGGRRRRFIWWLLGISSLPIHVLLNSAIYGSVQTSNSGVLIVSDDFQTDQTWESCNSTIPQGIKTADFACSLMQDFNAGRTVKLLPQQCLNQYADGFQSNASSVIVVTKTSARPYFSLPRPGLIGTVGPQYGVACKPNISDTLDDVQNTFDNLGNPIKYTSIPPSQRRYHLDFDSSSGDSNAYIPFMVSCSNTSQNVDGKSTWVIGEGINATFKHSTSSALFMTDQSPLLNISSVRSAFSAFEYRYWATAQHLDFDLESPDLTFAAKGWDSRSWLCPQEDLARGIECDPTQLDVSTKDWLITPSLIPVTECHVLPTKEQCALRYSTSILVIALVTDLTKLAAMMMALRLTSEPLATIGDAIESFLRRPDPYTEGHCLLNADTARKWSEEVGPQVKREVLQAALSNIPGYVNSASKIFLRNGEKNTHDTAVRATRKQVYQESQEDNDTAKPFLASQARIGGQLWSKAYPPPLTETWTPHRKRWMVVPSKSRWFYYICL